MRRARSGRWLLGLVGLAVWLTAAAPPAQAGDPVIVAVASNFAAPLTTLAERFEAATGQEVILVSGSTGKQYAQIIHGAPFHLFFAADAERPQRLEREGRTIPGTRFTYAIGRLALWSADPDLVDAHGLVLESDRFRRLAQANPRLAPYGRAARQTLERRGLAERLSPRLVMGENVAQTYQLIATGNAELGFVALSQLLQSKFGPAGSRWLVPGDLHDPIEQQAVLVRDSPAARAFLEYVAAPASADVIRDFGYEVLASARETQGSRRAVR